ITGNFELVFLLLIKYFANKAMILSPSISFPLSSTTINLSPSPSKAKPISAFSSTTFLHKLATFTAPQL
ncbi:hypothetical protein N9W05_05550, partial [Alphaproteobacteria bacterium]|nr:hypothetical protein [Alphaproteobacteria bacterium]